MSDKKRNIIALMINLFIAISTFILMVKGVASGASEGQVGESMIGLGYFKPYTVDSNVLNGIVCFMMATFNIYNLVEKKNELPRFLVVSQLVTTVGVTVTMMTVIFFLAPTQVLQGNGFLWLFAKDMFFLHLLNPILSILNFIFIDRRYKLNKIEIFMGLLTTLVYSFIYIYNVLISKQWSDFYGFTFGGKIFMAPVSILMMYGVSILFSYLLARFNSVKK